MYHSWQYRRHFAPMAVMNMVPYIDVMLVLLVIFMVTAPLLHWGLTVPVPQVIGAKHLAKTQHTPWVILDAKRQVWWQGRGHKQRLSVPKLTAQLKKRWADMLLAQHRCVLEIARSVPYQAVAHIMTVVHSAGAQSIGFVTRKKA